MILNYGNICLSNIKVLKCVVCLWIVCTFFSAIVSSQEFYPNGRFGRREDPSITKYKATVFQTGGRFGRSDSRMGQIASESKIIVPRIDRLYFGSRFGKRSESDDGERILRRINVPIEELIDGLEKKLLEDIELFRRVLFFIKTMPTPRQDTAEI